MHDLRSLPTDLTVTQLNFLDAMRIAVESVAISYRRLRGDLSEIGDALMENRGRAAEAVTCAVADAWAIVDSVYRAQRLLEAMPGLRRKNAAPEVQVFLRSTKTAETLRHKFQHLATDVKKIVDGEDRVCGTLAWFGCFLDAKGLRQLRSFILAPGWMRGGNYGILGESPGKINGKAEFIRLRCRGVEANLTNFANLSATLAGALRAALSRSTKSGEIFKHDVVAFLEPTEGEP